MPTSYRIYDDKGRSKKVTTRSTKKNKSVARYRIVDDEGRSRKVTKKSAPKKQKVSKKGATYHGEAPVKTIRTKGGDYNIYKKSSLKAKSFRAAFKSARKAGKKTFTWNGKKYSTKVKK